MEIVNFEDIIFDQQQITTEEAATASSVTNIQISDERTGNAIEDDVKVAKQQADYIKKVDEIVEIANAQAAALHRPTLEKIKSQIKPIDFRKLAKLKDDKSVLGKKHYVVCTVAEIIKTARRNNWGLCIDQNNVYLYNSQYWMLMGTAELQKFLGEAAEILGVDPIDAQYFTFRKELLQQFFATAFLPKPAKDNNVVLVNFKNGTLEISPEGQVFREFRAEDFITYQLEFDFDPTATAPLFESYLNKVQPDVDNQKILAEYLGYLFIKTSYLKLEKALLLYGGGSNGKSVFFEVVDALLGGRNNISNFSLQSLTDEKGYYRAKLSNVLLNYASEINGKLESSLFKQLVSGEPVEARLPYCDPFSITDYAKLIFNCNILPTDVEQTHAYFRRLQLIPFNVTISEVDADKELSKKITQKELSGVFNWVLLGLDRLLLQKGLTYSQAAKDQLALYKLQSDSVAMFIDEESYAVDNNSCIPQKELFSEYLNYCKECGYRSCANRTFGDRLKKLGFVTERRNIGMVVFAAKISY